ncbi:UDP-glycosyltransferase [Flavobacterium buctense]|uniref:UDP-glycosyltransferase n=1 Tax=Flavobacterium buctense TaxID=1648146 RepID=A0ABU9E0N1_9FLAO|nr:UDP-glycosyltransferase [Flavobacterium buctense]
MQYPKKIFLLLPDGVGLKNFAFTNFHAIGLERGNDITFWNNTPFDLNELGFKEIRFQNAKVHPLTDILKKAQTQIELNLSIKKSKDNVYDSYRFPFVYRDLKSSLKSVCTKGLVFWYNSEKGLNHIRKNIGKQERKTKLYFDSFETLQKEKPDFVFCTNQRTMLAVAPILAAQDLGIPTATFIFSWDNLPKATKIIETDYYFVWSDHMKNELLYYYPHLNKNQVLVTGTPQFETHTEKEIVLSKEVFFKEYNLDLSKKYICFSGDDVTTSPNDPTYLRDTALAVAQLNQKGYNLGIVFRRCPVDFSNRYNVVLEEFKDIITSVNPKWKKIGEAWHDILPTKEDLILQMNTIAHTEMVVNLGSSMVFDYVSFQKPCAYINYDVPNEQFPDWAVKNIYKFIHFRSMPNSNAVLWVNSPAEIEDCLVKGMGNEANDVIVNAQQWFEKINQHPTELASERIWTAIETITKE